MIVLNLYLNWILKIEAKIALENKWNLVSYGYQNDEKSNVIPESVYSLDFAPIDEILSSLPKVTGEFCCKSFVSRYVADDVLLDIEEVVLVVQSVQEYMSTTLYFQDFEPQERFILNALSTTVSYLIEGTTLTVTSNDSSQLIFELDQ